MLHFTLEGSLKLHKPNQLEELVATLSNREAFPILEVLSILVKGVDEGMPERLAEIDAMKAADVSSRHPQIRLEFGHT